MNPSRVVPILSTQDKARASSPVLTTRGETRQECFDRHYSKCIFKVGDRITFKKPKRNKVRGTIEYIEIDVDKMHWSEGGEVPRYVKVKVDLVNKETGLVYGFNTVWTTQNKILYGD
jgi:hypothetical protein